MNKKRKGRLFILFGPSGAGKSTLLSHILQIMPHNTLVPIITYTTRPARAHEVHGKDYYFIGSSEFIQKHAEGFFIHATKYLDSHYGAAKDILDQLIQGKSLIAIFDRAGAQEVKDTIPDAVLIWITAPLKELEHRLSTRYANDPAHYARRIALAQEDILAEQVTKIADYEIININLEKALQELIGIVKKELN